MEKIRNSGLLKLICYILIPIITASLVLSIAYIGVKDEYLANGEESYSKSDEFAYSYLSYIITTTNYIRENELDIDDGMSSRYNNVDNNIFYSSRFNYDNANVTDYIRYIIINNENGKMYTNMQSKDYSLDIENIKNNQNHWIYTKNNGIETDIEKIDKDNAKYMELPYDGIETLQEYSIYSYIDLTGFKYSNAYSFQMMVINLFNGRDNLAEILIPIDIILLCVIVVYLMWAVGHTNKKEGIVLNSLDRFPYELLVFVTLTIFCICIMLVDSIMYYTSISKELLYSLIQLAYIGSYISLLVLTVSTIKRLKAREFIHSFLIYKIYRKIKNKIKKETDKVLDKSDSQTKLVIFYIGFVIISSILGLTFFTGISFLALLALWIFTLYKLLEYNKNLNKIKNALHEIYIGNNNVKLDEQNLRGTLKELAIYVNDISNGFSNAVSESLKSERLKTELITNVSHDIKTPLTSIINYVDLLKGTDIKDEKAKEYIKVLDQKSQRLKKLIEDLVEASKASSGNVKLNIENINLNELLKQVTGEFEDKLNEKNIDVDLELPKENVNIKADNRYMYRIIENLFSNVCKYAMENTRVYIKLTYNNKQIYLEIKNISKEKLNISPDELMQRFVRGDKSRYTEGSGLGLSIARSLAELQNVKFDIEIDGDLFKAILIWDK